MGVGRLAVVSVVVAVVVMAVTLAVVVVYLRMILCVHIVGFSCFMKRPMDGPTDLRTDPLMEMRGRI